MQDTHCGLGFARGAVILLLRAWYCHKVHTSCCAGRSLWAWFCFVAQHLLRYCDTSYWTGSHSTLSYLICGTSSCSTELVLATRCNLNKINLVLFPLTVLRSLSFLIPSFTKINMSSDPVVHLPLTYAWGPLGVCHRDGSLAVLFPSLVGDSAGGCSIPVRKAQVASPPEWALFSSPVMQADW